MEYLHDCIIFSKGSCSRKRSRLENEVEFVLEGIELFDDIIPAGFIHNKMLLHSVVDTIDIGIGFLKEFGFYLFLYAHKGIFCGGIPRKGE